MSRFRNNTNSSNITIYYKKNSNSHNNINVDGIDIKDKINFDNNMLTKITEDNTLIDNTLIDNTLIDNTLIVKSHIPSIGYFSFDLDDLNSGKQVNNIQSSPVFYNRYDNNILDGLEVNYKLSIKDELFVKNNITAFSEAVISDINFKYNICDMVDGLEIINKLKPIRYKWKKNNKDMIGFIAQDVEKVLPIIVKDIDNIKVINENKIIPYLVNSIKNINKRLNEYRPKYI